VSPEHQSLLVSCALCVYVFYALRCATAGAVGSDQSASFQQVHPLFVVHNRCVRCSWHLDVTAEQLNPKVIPCICMPFTVFSCSPKRQPPPKNPKPHTQRSACYGAALMTVQGGARWSNLRMLFAVGEGLVASTGICVRLCEFSELYSELLSRHSREVRGG
jgi:hypothetical protein